MSTTEVRSGGSLFGRNDAHRLIRKVQDRNVYDDFLCDYLKHQSVQRQQIRSTKQNENVCRENHDVNQIRDDIS